MKDNSREPTPRSVKALPLVESDEQMIEALALEKFKAYFRANYPGLTLISDPDWHAPKIFNAVLSALEQARGGLR